MSNKNNKNKIVVDDVVPWHIVDPKLNTGGITLSCAQKDWGFGQITFLKSKSDGKWRCDTETMGKEFALKAIIEWIKTVKFDYDDDCELQIVKTQKEKIDLPETNK